MFKLAINSDKVNQLIRELNPLGESIIKKIKTPWGIIEPTVDIFPVIYLMVMYGLVYILPFGRDIISQSWFDWCRSEDGPLEWIQFFAFSLSFLSCCAVVWKRSSISNYKKWIYWLVLACICFFVAGEEISWGERITGMGFDSIRAINIQGESNIHNIDFFHHKLLDPLFEISCLTLGWFGWRSFPSIDAFPAKRYSLYFLPVALFYFYFDISYASTVQQIRNDQEIFELLMSIGILSHCWRNAFPIINWKTKS